MGCVGVCGSSTWTCSATSSACPPGRDAAGSRLAYAPGGKGANQAVAAARLGARVRFTGACGRDDFGDELAAVLRDDRVDIAGLCRVDVATGVALILVDDAGENQIVAIPGANDSVGGPRLTPRSTSGSSRPRYRSMRSRARSPQPERPVRPRWSTRHRRAGSPPSSSPATTSRSERDRARRPRREHPPHVVVTLGERGVRILPERTELPAPPAASSIRPAPATRCGCGCGGARGGTVARGRARVGDRDGLARGRTARLPAGDAEASEVEGRMRGAGRG